MTSGTLDFSTTFAEFALPASEHTLLAIDTSLGTTVAANRAGTVVELVSTNQRAHAEHIGALIAAALHNLQLTAADVTAVVMGTGPGAFTGLRVGMAAATAFAVGRQIPLLPLISHDASAWEKLCMGGSHPGTMLRIVQDARRKELFVTDYRVADQAGTQLLQQTPPAVVPRDGYVSAAFEYSPDRVSGVALLSLALHKLATGGDFAAPVPCYLRDPDVKQPAGVVSVASAA